MFFSIEEGFPFKHSPLSAIVTPRPIAWISTRDGNGIDNLAPYSFFNLTAYNPPQVMFASGMVKPDQKRSKDTVSNIEKSGEFCINVAEYSSIDAVNLSSVTFNKEEDEFDLTGVLKDECSLIDCPRVANAPASLECRLDQIIDLPGENNFLVLGTIVAVHLRDDCIVDGIFDITKYKPLTRLGYQDYGVISERFEYKRP